MDHIQNYIRHFDTILSRLCKNYEELDFAEYRYYRINQILLSMVQLWPYEQSTFITIYRILFLAILLSAIFFQFTAFLTHEYTINFLIELLAIALIYVLSLGQYYYFYTNFDQVRQMWRHIRNSWNSMKNETECDIMRCYSCIGEFTMIFMIIGGVVVGILYTCYLFSPIILDMIFPLNEPRPHTMDFVTEYFIDHEQYYYEILCHLTMSALLNSLLMIATYGFLIVYIHHICGLLKISCYRIEQAVNEYAVSNPEKKDGDFVQKIGAAVQIHQQALMYADFLTSTFVNFLLFVIIIGATTLSMNWLRLMRGLILQNTGEMLNALIMIAAHFVILFLTNYYGQLITDHNSEIFNNVYEVRWYLTSITIRKLLLFVMKKTTRGYYLNFGGNLLTASIETFAKLFRLWMSYSTVIYSLIK